MPLTKHLSDSVITIIVMGQTGSAKSTFINTLLGKELEPVHVPVGKSLEECTKRITGMFLTNTKRLGEDRLFIMDTPGLDYESEKENVEIINQINSAAIDDRAGIIYFHNIDQIRPNKPNDKQQELFKRFTDLNGWHCLVFGITMWNASRHNEEGIQGKEKAFREIFGDMLQIGAEIVQVQNGQPESAWNAVEQIRKAIKHKELLEKGRKQKNAVIMLLGQTGSGKSTFIAIAGDNTLERKPRIGHELELCTKRVEEFPLEDPREPGQYVRLIDTPGFNSGTAGDQTHLKMIIEWLRKEPETQLSGILFLDDGEPHQRRAKPLVPTLSDIPQNPPGMWVITTKKNMRDHSSYSTGVHVKHFDNNRDSAWEIIHDVQLSGSKGHISFRALAIALDPKSTEHGKGPRAE